MRFGKRLLDGPVDPIANFGQQAGGAPAGTRQNLDHGAVDPAYGESPGIGGRPIVQPEYPAYFQFLAFVVQGRKRIDVDPSTDGSRSVGDSVNRVGGPDVKRERPPFVGIGKPDHAPGDADLDPLLERVNQGRLYGFWWVAARTIPTPKASSVSAATVALGRRHSPSATAIKASAGSIPSDGPQRSIAAAPAITPAARSSCS